jgi:hypothetical protein
MKQPTYTNKVKHHTVIDKTIKSEEFAGRPVMDCSEETNDGDDAEDGEADESIDNGGGK